MNADGTTTAPAHAPRVEGRAFDLAGGPDAALLLHGLTGSPYEMRHVADALHRTGAIRCVGPIMPGHGGAPGALLPLRWEDWVEGARGELRRLSGARRVFLVGCSMGALVACVLAREATNVAGLALLAPALHLGRAARLAAILARTPIARVRPLVPKLGGSDVRDPEQRRVNPTMPAVPLAAVAELAALSRHVDALLPRILVPALVIAGRHDHTVKLSGALRIASRIGSAPARVVVLERSFHLVGIDVERDRCAAEVVAFVQNTVPVGADGLH